MWSTRRITEIAIRPWTWAALGLAVLPALIGMGFTALHRDLGQGLVLGLGGLLLFAGLQAIYGALYNRIAQLGVVLVFADRACMKVPVSSAWPALAVWAVLQGWGVALWGGVAGAWALIGPMLGFLPVGLFVLGCGSCLLYNHVVVPFYGTLTWTEDIAEGRVRITALDPHQWRLILAALFFAWAAALLLLAVLALLATLAFVSQQLPKGMVSLGLAVFTGFLMALVGFLMAILVGWWMYLAALLYNHWSRGGGGLEFREDAQRVVL